MTDIAVLEINNFALAQDREYSATVEKFVVRSDWVIEAASASGHVSDVGDVQPKRQQSPN